MANVQERTHNLERQVARLEANQGQVLSMMGELKAAIERLTREQASSAAGQDNNNVEVEAMDLDKENDAGAEERMDVAKGEKNKDPGDGKDRKDVLKGEKNKDKAEEAKERKDMSNAKFATQT